jgi:hypothetical protein
MVTEALSEASQDITGAEDSDPVSEVTTDFGEVDFLKKDLFFSFAQRSFSCSLEFYNA